MDTFVDRLHMLKQLLEGTPVSIDIASTQMLSSEIVAAVKKCGCRFGAREKLTTSARIELPPQETGFRTARRR